jgi:hypothetical protein
VSADWRRVVVLPQQMSGKSGQPDGYVAAMRALHRSEMEAE